MLKNNPFAAANNVVNKLKTSREIKSGFRLILKGGIPEPLFPAQTFPILGHSAMSFGSLKQGELNNTRKYFFDTTNLILSPETGRLEETVENSEIMPAIGPNFTAKFLSYSIENYTSIITKTAIRAANEYWRQLTIEMLQLYQNLSFFRKGNGASGKTYAQLVTAFGTGIDSSVAPGIAASIAAIRQHGINEATQETEDISLIWANEIYPPNRDYGSGSELLMKISKASDNFLLNIFGDGLIDESTEFNAAYASLHHSRDEILKSFDLTPATQDAFGHEGVECIERTVSQSFIPFYILGPALTKGSPNILRIHLKSPPGGMEHNRVNFDLSDKIRMSIEQGTAVKILRRRDDSELEKYFKDLNKAEKAEILKDIDLKAATKEKVKSLEDKLEALYLSLLIYDSTGLDGDDSYNQVLSKLTGQQEQLNDLRKELANVRNEYREKAKTQAGHKLSGALKAQRELALKAIKDKIADLKKNIGKNEVIRRKIAHYKKIIYAQEDTWQLASTAIKDTPVEISIIDYGMGMILFEANGGKDAFIFKDKETIEKNIKADKKLTKNQSIKTLGPNSFTWLVGGSRLKITGNGGSFTFAQDSVTIGEGSITLPISTNRPIQVESKKLPNGKSQLVMQQDMDTVLITNLDAYSKTTEENKGVIGSVESKGGKITAELLPGGDPTDLIPKDMPNYTKWVKFLNGDEKDPYSTKAVDTQYYTYRIKITFTPDKDNTTLPLLFRGFMNIKAVAREWSELDSVPHILEPGDNVNQKPYTIKVEPTFNEEKRRVVYQVEIKYKEGVPDDIQNRMYDYMTGKRCDIQYLFKGTWYTIMTDGYIGDVSNEDMLTITTPPDPTTSAIGGFYHYGGTKTTFNVMDSMRFIEDKIMSEGLILEGYNFRSAIHTILTNSGFTENKLLEIKNNTLTGKYVNVKNPTDKYIPIALPGGKHSFICDESSTRSAQISSILQRYGWDGQGVYDIWVDRDGTVKLSSSVSVNRDPRWGNLFFYRSRLQSEKEEIPFGEDQEQVARFTYLGEITRKRTLDDFYSTIKVSGAPHPITGKPIVIGFKKKEVVADEYKNENIYLGHHKELATIDVPDVRTEEELIAFLYAKVNQYVGIKEIWSIKVPYNPFLLPYDVVFIAPDNKYGGPLDNGGYPAKSLSSPPTATTITAPSELIAWKVVNISASVETDSMTLTLVPPNREEKKAIKEAIK